MSEFISIHDVGLDDLLLLLQAWEDGELSDEHVQAWAERISEGEEWPHFSKSDPRSAMADVIQLLDLMYGQHVLRRDIPALRMFLQTYQISPEKASQEFDTYWSRLHLDERRKIPRE